MTKKLVVVLMALLFVTGGLVAQEEGLVDKLSFKYGGMLYIYNTRQRTVDGGDPNAFWETRLRQYLSVGNKNIEVMVKLEMDPTWGYAAGATSTDNVNLEADMKGELQIKNAYLRFTSPSMPLTVKAGVLFHMSPGMLVFANDFGGITLNYKTDSMELNGMYGKMSEDSDLLGTDDAEIFGVSASLGSKSFKLTPALYYIYTGATVDTGNLDIGAGLNNESNYHGVFARTSFIPQVNLMMKLGNFNLCATVAYGFGTIKDLGPTDIDASGLGVDIKAKYAINKDIKVGFMFNYLTGDEDGATGGLENFAQFMPGYIAGGSIERGVRLTAASLFLQGGLTAHPNENIGKKDVYLYGLFLFGFNADITVGKMSFSTSFAILNSAVNHAGGSKSYGMELDLFLNYEIYKNLFLQIEASFFKPSDDYKANNTFVGAPMPDLCSFWAVGTSFKW